MDVVLGEARCGGDEWCLGGNCGGVGHAGNHCVVMVVLMVFCGNGGDGGGESNG